MKLFKTKYDGYFISRDGKVFSAKRNDIRPIAQFKDGRGYLRVEIRVQKRKGKSNRKKLFVHKLIAESLFKKPKGKARWYVVHKNDKRQDNRAVNLRIQVRGK